MLDNDYFLAALKDEFVENARLFIFETYCRIHQCIDLRMLAGGLHPSHFHPGRHCLFIHSEKKGQQPLFDLTTPFFLSLACYIPHIKH